MSPAAADGELAVNEHIGMGLGLFIAKTLLERTGARVTFGNGRPRGAVVTVRWRRDDIEATSAIGDETRLEVPPIPES